MTRLHRLLASEAAKFLLAGGVSYIVNQIALVVLYEYVLGTAARSLRTPLGSLNLGLLCASVIAVEISIIARFALNDGWTFRSRRNRPLAQRFLQSNLSSLASPIIALLALNILTPVYDVNYLIANSLGIALGLAWNWAWSTRVVWRQPVDAAAG